MRLLSFSSDADLQCIFQNLQRNVIAEIGVVVMIVRPWRFSGFEYDPEVSNARKFDVALPGPPVERWLIVLPGELQFI